MTMHLLRGMSTTNTKKPKAKNYTANQLKKLEVEWHKYNKEMRRKHLHKFQLDSLDDYLKHIRGEYKPKKVKEFVPYEPSKTYRRETKNIPSRETTVESIPGFAPRKEPNVYTGTLIKGIGTMHKSNAVPVIDQEQMKDLANMRR